MSAPSSPGEWRVLASQSLTDSPHLQVTKERIATPTRPDGVDWMVVHRKQAAIVAPRDREGRYYLIRQERVAVRQTLWEFPAGQVDGEATPSEILAAAARELGEETGLVSRGEYIPLGHYFSSPGMTDECGHLFLATEVEERSEGVKFDEHEAILEVRGFTAGELRQMIAQGEIVDANTLVTFARLEARGIYR